MGSQDNINKAADAIKDTIDDAKDAIHETQHRSAAEAEAARRKALGDDMTVSEKAGSALDEAKQTVQAEIDAAKRHIRDHT